MSGRTIPLEKIFPAVFIYGIVFNYRKDNRVISKFVYSVAGINMEELKYIPRL